MSPGKAVDPSSRHRHPESALASARVSAVLPLSLALVVSTACLLTAAGRPRSPVSFTLGVYLLAWAEVVLVVLGLSLFGAVRSGTLVGTFAVAFAVALACWALGGAPWPPSFRPGIRSVASALRDPPLAILGTLAVLVFAYAAVLGILTPQDEWDALTYHLARAALWAQQGRVGYIPGAFDVRLDANPPNAEIGQLAALVLGGSERFVWLPQFGAALAMALSVFGIARRFGWTVRESLFGTLVLATLPLIALQLSSALNDLVVAAFFTAAVYFALGIGRRTGAAAVLALALGVGTKMSGPLLLVIFVLVVVAARRRRLLETAAIAVAGTLAGSAWYVVNIVNTGALDGHLARLSAQVAERTPVAAVSRAFRLGVSAFELPGAQGSDARLYVECAAVFLLVGSIAYFRRAHAGKALLIAAALTLAIPILVYLIARASTDSWHWGWRLAGRRDIADRVPAYWTRVSSDSVITWFGPVGVSLVIISLVLVARTRAPDRLARIALAASPLVFIGVVAVALTFDPWRGRFFVFPMALAASTWGSAYRFRGLTWAVTGLVVTTTLLVVAHSNEKPPGLRLLAGHAEPSVFGAPRWSVQTQLRDTDGTRTTLRYVQDHVPPNASIGLALRGDDYVFPYFGSSLDRTVTLIRPGMKAPPAVEWIVEAPGRKVPRCAGAWQTQLRAPHGFRVLRRISADPC